MAQPVNINLPNVPLPSLQYHLAPFQGQVQVPAGQDVRAQAHLYLNALTRAYEMLPPDAARQQDIIEAVDFDKAVQPGFGAASLQQLQQIMQEAVGALRDDMNNAVQNSTNNAMAPFQQQLARIAALIQNAANAKRRLGGYLPVFNAQIEPFPAACNQNPLHSEDSVSLLDAGNLAIWCNYYNIVANPALSAEEQRQARIDGLLAAIGV